MTVIETRYDTFIGTIVNETNTTITIDDGVDYITIDKDLIEEMYED